MSQANNGLVNTWTSMRTNAIDRTSSLLLSLIVALGLSVLTLGLYFFWGSFQYSEPAERMAVSQGTGIGGSAGNSSLPFDTPAGEETASMEELSAEQVLQMVNDTILESEFALVTLDELIESGGKSNGKGGSFLRPAGKGNGVGGNEIPRYERWQLRMVASDRQSYARQLDALQIDLGAIGGGIATVDYVTRLSTKTTKYSVTPAEEKARRRLMFASESDNVFVQYDKQIIRDAGIPTDGRYILKFVSRETELKLAIAEAEHYTKSTGKAFQASAIAMTTFQCVRKSNGSYEFAVASQTYRKD